MDAVRMPENSNTHARTVVPPVMVIATEVWPPAQLGSAQVDRASAPVPRLPTVFSAAQLPADPPSVTDVTWPVPLPAPPATQATRQLPGVVGEPRVTVRLADAPVVLLA